MESQAPQHYNSKSVANVSHYLTGHPLKTHGLLVTTFKGIATKLDLTTVKFVPSLRMVKLRSHTGQMEK
jgi:hypothetical protein